MLVYQNDNSVRNNYFYYDIFQNTGWVSHFHKCYEMIYAMEGDSQLGLDEEQFLLKEGEMCLVMPNQIHSFWAAQNSRLWVCVFSVDLVGNFWKETKGKKYEHPVFWPSETLVDFLPRERNVEFDSVFLMQAFLFRLCHEFYQQGFSWTDGLKTDTDSIHKIMSYISLHFNQDITLSLLAREFGLNKNYISDLIGEVTHQNFRTYLNGYRIEKAKELLADSDLTVTDICYECGYSSIRTFNRVFWSMVHMTPREYREGCGLTLHK